MYGKYSEEKAMTTKREKIEQPMKAQPTRIAACEAKDDTPRITSDEVTPDYTHQIAFERELEDGSYDLERFTDFKSAGAVIQHFHTSISTHLWYQWIVFELDEDGDVVKRQRADEWIKENIHVMRDYFRYTHDETGEVFCHQQDIRSPFPSMRNYTVERVTRREYQEWLSEQQPNEIETLEDVYGREVAIPVLDPTNPVKHQPIEAQYPFMALVLAGDDAVAMLWQHYRDALEGKLPEAAEIFNQRSVDMIAAGIVLHQTEMDMSNLHDHLSNTEGHNLELSAFFDEFEAKDGRTVTAQKLTELIGTRYYAHMTWQDNTPMWVKLVEQEFPVPFEDLINLVEQPSPTPTYPVYPAGTSPVCATCKDSGLEWNPQDGYYMDCPACQQSYDTEPMPVVEVDDDWMPLPFSRFEIKRQQRERQATERSESTSPSPIIEDEDDDWIAVKREHWQNLNMAWNDAQAQRFEINDMLDTAGIPGIVSDLLSKTPGTEIEQTRIQMLIAERDNARRAILLILTTYDNLQSHRGDPDYEFALSEAINRARKQVAAKD
jgi:hypothetical protein